MKAGCTVWLDLDRSDVPVGGSLGGTLWIRAGGRPAVVTQLGLTYLFIGPDGSREPSPFGFFRFTEPVSFPLRIEADERRGYRLEITVPVTAPVPSEMEVAVQLTLANLFDTQSADVRPSFPVHVLPPEELTQILRVLEEVSGFLRAWFVRPSWSRSGQGGFVARLEHPARADHPLRVVRLELLPEPQRWYGTLTVFPKERGGFGSLRALLRGGDRTFMVCLNAGDVDGTRAAFEAILGPFLRPAGIAGALPIPNAPPVGLPEQLPRPANAAPEDGEHAPIPAAPIPLTRE